MKTHRHMFKIRQLILLGLVLRVVVPVGFMPANLGDGWYLKLCPEGMSVNSMVALLGHHHHYHHHAHDEEASFDQCDLAGFSSLAALSANNTPEFSILYVTPVAVIPVDRYDRDTLISYRPRAPPIS